MRNIVLFLLSIIVFCQCLVGFTFACNENVVSIGGEPEMQPREAEHIPNELFIKFKEGINPPIMTTINKDLGTEVVNVLGDGLLHQVKVPTSANLEEVKRSYEALPEVEYVEVNYVVGIEPMPQEIQQAIDEAGEWLKIDGVEGVAPGEVEGRTLIVVFASVPPSQLAGRIPTTFKGFSVVIEETGVISAESEPQIRDGGEDEFLSHKVMLKEKLELRDAQEGFAGVSGEILTIDRSGRWEVSQFLNEEVSPPKKSGQLTQEQMEGLGNILSKHEFSGLPEHFGRKGMINRRIVSINFGQKISSLELIGGEPLNDTAPLMGDPQASKWKHFVAIVEYIKKSTSRQ